MQADQKAAFDSFAVHDDQGWSDYWSANSPEEAEYYNQYGAYVDHLQDIRRSLEMMQDYRYSDPGSLSTSDFGKNEFEGSREFRGILNDSSFLGMPKWNSAGSGIRGYNFQSQGDRLQGATASEVQQSGLENFQDNPEMLYLTDIYVEARDQLYQTQRAAGTSMGFNEQYGHAAPDYLPTYEQSLGVFDEKTAGSEYYYFQPTAFHGLESSGWALYQDGTWEFGALDTADELHDALAKIEASGDGDNIGTPHYRNEDQRAYLAQKAYTRYLFSKINALGGHDYLTETDGTRDTVFSGYDNRTQDESRPGPSADSIGYDWALDPMYSRLDDQDMLYGSFGTDVVHRDGYVPPDIEHYGQEGDALHQLQEAGIIGAGEDNPDYIAGRFTDAQQWADAFDGNEGSERDQPWDEKTQTHVAPNSGGSPGSTYDPDTNTYVMSDYDRTMWGYVEDDPGAVLPELDPDAAPVDDVFFDDRRHDDDDGGLPEPDSAGATAEAAAQYQEWLDSLEPPKQTVPDEHPGATHVHDEPREPEYVPEVHALHQWAADPTMPMHIPVQQIAAEIQQGAAAVDVVQPLGGAAGAVKVI